MTTLSFLLPFPQRSGSDISASRQCQGAGAAHQELGGVLTGSPIPCSLNERELSVVALKKHNNNPEPGWEAQMPVDGKLQEAGVLVPMLFRLNNCLEKPILDLNPQEAASEAGSTDLNTRGDKQPF